MLDKMPFCGALNQQPACPNGRLIPLDRDERDRRTTQVHWATRRGRAIVRSTSNRATAKSDQVGNKLGPMRSEDPVGRPFVLDELGTPNGLGCWPSCGINRDGFISGAVHDQRWQIEFTSPRLPNDPMMSTLS